MKKIQVEQLSIFGPEKTADKTSVSTKSSPVSSSKSKPLLNLSLLSAIDKNAAKADGIYWLRVMANQYSRGLSSSNNKAKLIKAVQSEIAIKSGELPIEIAAIDAILKKYLF